MKKTLHKIVFFGNERLATGVSTEAPTLLKLIKAGYEVVAVISNYETGISRAARRLEIAEVAQAYNIPLFTPSHPQDITDQLRKYNAPMAILVAYGRIVPKAVLELFPHGIINIHPSLLPDKRGPTPIEQTLLDGDQETGVSLMRLSQEMDTGPLYAQKKLPLSGSETKQALATKLIDIGSDLLIENLPTILSGKLDPIPQPESQSSYTSLIKKADGEIDWQKPASRIEKEIRAYAIWPRSRTTLGNIDLIITEAVIYPKSGKPGSFIIEDDSLVIFCGENSLHITKLQPSGKKEMLASEFIRGYKQKLELS